MVKGAGTVVVNIIGKADELKKSLDQADKDLGGFSGKLDNFGKTTMATGAKFTAGLTLPIVGGFALATKAAAEDEAAQARLAKTLQNTVGASDDVVASVEKQIGAMMKVSTFADDDLRPAYENLVRETRNVKEATNLMQTAMDLAAAKGISVEEASGLLVKAHNGQTKALAALGIETKNTEGKAASYGDIMRDVNKVVGGQAAAATETAAGKTKMLQRDMGELVETLGVALVPIMEKVVGWVQTITDKFSTLSPGVQTAILVTAGLAAAIGPLVTLVGGLTVALGFLAANPIVLVVAAIVGLIAIVVAAKNGWIELSDGAIGAINLLLGVVRTLAGAFFVQFQAIIEFAAHAFGWIPGIGDKIHDAKRAFYDFRDSVIGALGPVQSQLEKTRVGVQALNGEALKWYQIAQRPLAPGVLGPVLGAGPPAPRAAGGPVWPGKAFMVGEKGPELFTPGQGGVISPTGSFGGAVVSNSYSIAVTALDPGAAQEAVIAAIKEFERRNGTGWRAA